jgi:5'-deoxynucleotidase YfbR-like HD superfamily hydrolase
MNSVLMKRIWMTRRLSFVPRWVVMPTIRKQNVAEHSFHVVCIADALIYSHVRRNNMSFRLQVLQSALYHDDDEAVTGDHPSPTKDAQRRDPSTLRDFEIVVKVADKIEAALFCSEEQAMGNDTVGTVYEDTIRRGDKYWPHFEWDSIVGSKPSFRELVSMVADKTSIYKHPVLHGFKSKEDAT